jgi:hypothetical protein
VDLPPGFIHADHHSSDDDDHDSPDDDHWPNAVADAVRRNVVPL